MILKIWKNQGSIVVAMEIRKANNENRVVLLMP